MRKTWKTKKDEKGLIKPVSTEKEESSEVSESSQKDSEVQASEESAPANPLGDSLMSFGKKDAPQTASLL